MEKRASSTEATSESTPRPASLPSASSAFALQRAPSIDAIAGLAQPAGSGITADAALSLQRICGNAVVARLIARRAIPPNRIGTRLLQRTEYGEGEFRNRPNLVAGDTGAGVRLLQSLLGVKVTGVFDQATRAAVDQFQHQQGWEPSGVGPMTWEKLETHAGNAGARPNLRLGDRGPGVKLLQTLLGVPETSVFDQTTRKAMDAFQRAQGWEPSGVGPMTWAALDARASLTSGAITGEADRISELAARQRALTDLAEFKKNPPEARWVDSIYGARGFFAQYLPQQGVLVAKVRCRFTFEAGKSELFFVLQSGKRVRAKGAVFDPSDPIVSTVRDPIEWAGREAAWKRSYLELCSKAWTEPRFTFYCHKDWWEELTARTEVTFEDAVPGEKAINVTVTAGSGATEKEDVHMSLVHVYEDSILPSEEGQVVAIHESGHMLGLEDEYKPEGEAPRPAAQSKLVHEEFGHDVIRGRPERTSIMSTTSGTRILPEHGVVFLAGLRNLTAGAIPPDAWHVRPKRELPGRREAVTPKETLEVTSKAQKKGESATPEHADGGE
jgi:peptidoglycan hydrolase-like protein with peptidoglycan-binding domain